MPITPKQVLRMHLLLATRDSTKALLQEEYPNVAFVIANPTAPAPKPTSVRPHGQDLFAKIDKDVYEGYHKKLKALNGNQPGVPDNLKHDPDRKDLVNYYGHFAGFTRAADEIFPDPPPPVALAAGVAGEAAAPPGLWREGQHPDDAEQADWQTRMS